jgi:hypothetical protein
MTNPASDFFVVGDFVRPDPFWQKRLTFPDVVYIVTGFLPSYDGTPDGVLTIEPLSPEYPRRDGMWPSYLCLCTREGQIIDRWPYGV